MIISPDSVITKMLSVSDIDILEDIENTEEVLFETITDFNDIKVVKNKCGLFLKFEDSYQAGLLNTPLYQGNLPYTNYFLLSLVYNPEIKNILFLGMGSATIIKDFIKLAKKLKNVDIVELDPAIPDIATNYFEFEEKNPIKLYIQDARIFLRSIKKQYDLIICDAFSAEGMSYRFMTEEFFMEASEKLSKEGIFCSNVFSNENLNHSNNIIFKALYKTLAKNFSVIDIFPTRYGNFEMYRHVIGLKGEITDLTNVILMAQKKNKKLSKNDLLNKSGYLQRNVNLLALKSLKKYASDLCEDKINLDSIKILKDNFIEDKNFTVENMSKYLLIEEK